MSAKRALSGAGQELKKTEAPLTEGDHAARRSAA